MGPLRPFKNEISLVYYTTRTAIRRWPITGRMQDVFDKGGNFLSHQLTGESMYCRAMVED